MGRGNMPSTKHATNRTLLDLDGFLFVWSNGKSYGSAKISFILPLSASKAKEQHKKNTKHVKIT
jgi:hypothetical protein